MKAFPGTLPSQWKIENNIDVQASLVLMEEERLMNKRVKEAEAKKAKKDAKRKRR